MERELRDEDKFEILVNASGGRVPARHHLLFFTPWQSLPRTDCAFSRTNRCYRAIRCYEKGRGKGKKKRYRNDTRYVGEPRDVSCDTGEGRACSRCTLRSLLHALQSSACTEMWELHEPRTWTYVRVRKQLSRSGAHERASAFFMRAKISNVTSLSLSLSLREKRNGRNARRWYNDGVQKKKYVRRYSQLASSSYTFILRNRLMKRSYHAIDVNFTRESLGIYFFPLFFFFSLDRRHTLK